MEVPELGIYDVLNTFPFNGEEALSSQGRESFDYILAMLKRVKGIVVSGGFALSLYKRVFKGIEFGDRTNGFTDFDIYLYGEHSLKETIPKILEGLKETYCSRSELVLNVNAKGIYGIQIMLVNYKSVKEILDGFDMGCCQVAFDINNWYVTSYFQWSFRTGYVLSYYGCYERYTKYENRGFKFINKELNQARTEDYNLSLLYPHDALRGFLNGDDIITLVSRDWWACDLMQSIDGIEVVLEVLWDYLGLKSVQSFGPPETQEIICKSMLDTLSRSSNPEHIRLIKRLKEYRLPLELTNRRFNNLPDPKLCTWFRPIWSRKYYAFYPGFVDLGMYLLENGLCLDIIKRIFRTITLLNIPGIERLWSLFVD